MGQYLSCVNKNSEVDADKKLNSQAASQSSNIPKRERQANERTALSAANKPLRPKEPPRHKPKNAAIQGNHQNSENNSRVRSRADHGSSEVNRESHGRRGRTTVSSQDDGLSGCVHEDPGAHVTLKETSKGDDSVVAGESQGMLSGHAAHVSCNNLMHGSNNETRRLAVTVPARAYGTSNDQTRREADTKTDGLNATQQKRTKRQGRGAKATSDQVGTESLLQEHATADNMTTETGAKEQEEQKQRSDSTKESHVPPKAPPRTQNKKKRKKSKEPPNADQTSPLASDDQRCSPASDPNLEVYRIEPRVSTATDMQRLVIGIDIGSNSSGYTYSIAGAKDCCFNRNWAGSRGYTALKAPTAYCDYKDEVHFGFEAFEKYEELLDESDDDIPRSVLFYQSAYCNPYVSSDTEILVRSVCLYLLNHCCEAVQQKIIGFSNLSEVKIILAIGNNWHQVDLHSALNDIQKKATEVTGITQVVVDAVPMTECELRSCLLSTQKYRKGTKDMVLLLSAGGNHIEAKQFASVERSKNKWQCVDHMEVKNKGSQSIDSLFVKDLEQVLGQDFVEALIQKSESTCYSFMESFNHVKSSIGPNTTLNVSLPLTYMFGRIFADVKLTQLSKFFDTAPQCGFSLNKDSKLAINSDTMKSYFDGVLNNIRNILHHFRPALESAGDSAVVYFVGGLSESPLVKATVLEELHNLQCELIIPEHSNLCAARGAVLCDKSR